MGGEFMASLQVYKCRGNQYARIVESYRDKTTGKPRINVLKNLGSVDILTKNHPNALQEIRDKLKRDSETKTTLALENALNALSEETEEGFRIRNYGCLVYDAIMSEIKLDYFTNYRKKTRTRITFDVAKAVRMLVQSRLMAPSSKLRAHDCQGRYVNFEDDEVSLEQTYRVLSFLDDEKSALEYHLSKMVTDISGRDLSIAFYDVTTYYFESVNADALRDFGYSKDNKVNQVQVVMGLLIDSDGIPVAYDLFPGNTNDFGTLEPTMKRLREEYGIRKVIITADRGLNSKKNLGILRSLGYGYVMAYKIKSASAEMKREVFDDAGYVSESCGFRWKESSIRSSVRMEDGTSVELDDRLLITWSSKRAAKDAADRERLLNKAKDLVESKSRFKSEMKKGGKKYVQLGLFDTLEPGLDTKRAAEDGLLDGYYAVQCSDKSMTPQKILETYRGLWKIEESFRVMKSCLESRPVFVWSASHIRGHFCICYLALVIQRLLECKLRKVGIVMSSERIQSALNSANVTEIPLNGGTRYLRADSNEDFRVILEGLGMKDIGRCDVKKPKLN
jgi:transposase